MIYSSELDFLPLNIRASVLMYNVSNEECVGGAREQAFVGQAFVGQRDAYKSSEEGEVLFSSGFGRFYGEDTV